MPNCYNYLQFSNQFPNQKQSSILLATCISHSIRFHGINSIFLLLLAKKVVYVVLSQFINYDC